jgi:hypothetical protein
VRRGRSYLCISDVAGNDIDYPYHICMQGAQTETSHQKSDRKRTACVYQNPVSGRLLSCISYYHWYLGIFKYKFYCKFYWKQILQYVQEVELKGPAKQYICSNV